MRIALALLMIVHGLIHIVGFTKAYQFGSISQFTKEISRPMGILWFVSALLFIATTLGFVLKKDWWSLLGIVSVVISQSLIVTGWADAKYGTIANAIILIAVIVSQCNLAFEGSYTKDVDAALKAVVPIQEILNEKDLEPLPMCVQKYLAYVGAVGKPKVYNMKIVFKGEMRDKGKDWFFFTSEQYNFMPSPMRLFFMKARVMGLPTFGYHKYTNEMANMRIKLLSLFSVVDLEEPELYPTETVTFFNDLCLFAPAALIDHRITWETLDAQSARATFDNNGTSISAILYFNEKGQLVNFVSNDRYSVSEMKAFPFSTPVSAYKNVNGYLLPTYGEGIWHYPEGEFVYGKFRVVDIAYNVSE
ncbi:hypothetical protein MWU78_04550 [Arenibacter sp. F26102]|uniref:DUF6544 family protein n=1 Tax=Arenibacter sp. F26102 TaxID=2926416 RepID=UPI001FF5A9FD|nr:DUF6544 family protein [Arenibacter sp. F26102]MCK0144915.1 hypothetical protein [Arenibacter sp. F26102]